MIFNKYISIMLIGLLILIVGFGLWYFFIGHEVNKRQYQIMEIKSRNLPLGYYELINGGLQQGNPTSPIHIVSHKPLIVTFHKGGGHLSARGVVYAEEGTSKKTLQELFSESISIQQKQAEWWEYYSHEG
jgi:hypothetical protein